MSQILDLVVSQVSDALQVEKVDKKIAVDPMMIDVILQIILAAIQAYQKCQQPPAQVVADLKSLNLMRRWQLRRLILQHINDGEVSLKLGSQVFTAISKVGATLTEESVNKMFSEVH
jgi:hypothetical protein